MKTCKTCKYKNEDNDCEAITEGSEIVQLYAEFDDPHDYACDSKLIISVDDDFGCVLHEENE